MRIEIKSPVPSAMAVRDSKVRRGPAPAFPATAWNTFVASVKA
ncbi:hypothetical protein SGLAM104S_05631 [Streptomyces glaucescens]